MVILRAVVCAAVVCAAAAAAADDVVPVLPLGLGVSDGAVANSESSQNKVWDKQDTF